MTGYPSRNVRQEMGNVELDGRGLFWSEKTELDVVSIEVILMSLKDKM